MSAITSPVYDPTSTAAAMAQKSTAATQQIITQQTTTASTTAKALSSLGSAISAFQTSLSSLTGIGKSMLAQSATLSDTSIGTASAKPTAAAGSYSLFVDRLATASQVSYTPVDDPTAQGTLTITLAPPVTPAPATPTPSLPATASFTVDLSTADTDGVAGLSVREVATAINNDPKNAGQVSAGVVTVNGTAQLVLTSKNSGVANTIWVSSAGPVDPKTGAPLLDQNGNAIPAYNLGSRTEITTAQDAMIHYGGTAITNPSNTFNNIDGVSMTFTRAQSASEQPFTLKVAGDSNGTAGNVQAFIDAYNKLKSTVDAMVAPGDPASGMAAGAFAHDAGMQALQSSLVNLMRPTGTNSLASYGITATRDGTLSLDSTRLNKQLSVNPTGLDALIGSASLTTSTGVAGSLNSYLNLWSNSATGQLKQRSDATTTLQATLTQRQADLDTQYNSAYSRYLKQFTDLQTLQSTMNSNVSMFDALFGSKSN